MPDPWIKLVTSVRRNSFRVATRRSGLQKPRVAKAQPWAEISERFQRFKIGAARIVKIQTESIAAKRGRALRACPLLPNWQILETTTGLFASSLSSWQPAALQEANHSLAASSYRVRDASSRWSAAHPLQLNLDRRSFILCKRKIPRLLLQLGFSNFSVNPSQPSRGKRFCAPPLNFQLIHITMSQLNSSFFLKTSGVSSGY